MRGVGLIQATRESPIPKVIFPCDNGLSTQITTFVATLFDSNSSCESFFWWNVLIPIQFNGTITYY